ncbi:hypothetical protein L873DRAFT_1806964 [Choiromyces venosus 120613-1]|uniref:Uncharacterized protein n=1 Tax=Choiromyces venosus 120613-1 TaxID=1336337 RepID=A0A3N4JML7_9PEZI|nr:hypothetical protein L873DRAFT_1806964 [Choiromyces venosus 120613-1]
MQLIKFISFAALILGVAATPTPEISVRDGPTSLPKEAIPAGAKVFGLPESEPEPGLDPRSIFKRDDCDGSGLCHGSTSGGACTAATNAYVDDAWYCGYTSRVSDHCTAIFTCTNYHGVCWAGRFLKQQFREIYTHLRCGVCGSRYFDSNNCRATYNYCRSCSSVG